MKGNSRLSTRQRLEHHAARVLAALPDSAQIRLSGKPPLTIDGASLAPEVQLSLALMERRGDAALETLPLAQARISRRNLAAVYAGDGVRVGGSEEIEIDAGVPLRTRHYVPPENPSRRRDGGLAPLLVYYHGGGFTYGDLDTHDAVCRLLCVHVDAHVLAVDYRLAPEHPFPAAVEDARAALRWAFENASRLGASKELVGVAGDSAGGNLAAVVSQLAAAEGGPAPALQLLIYPAVDFTTKRRSRELFGKGFLLTEPEMQWFERNYLGPERNHASDPRASPLLGTDLSGLAPAIVITAGFDPLRDEGEEYAEALRNAGNTVVLRRFGSFIHGFINATGVSRDCREAVIEIAGITRGLFAISAARLVSSRH